MTIRYYDQPRYRKVPLVRALFAANLLFAIATLVAWQSAFLYFILPLSWATDRSISIERDYWHLLEYPLVIFWSGPALAMAVAWVLIQNQKYKAAFGVLSLPMVAMALTFTMYWSVPNAGQ